MILGPETSKFVDQARELYVPGDEAYAHEQGMTAYASTGITIGRSYLELPSAVIYDGSIVVTVESSLSRSAIADYRTFSTARELGKHLAALQFELSISVAYPIRYDDHLDALHMRRTITVNNSSGRVADFFIADVPTCDNRLQKPADQDNTIAFINRVVDNEFSPAALASGLIGPNIWPVFGNDEIETLAIGPVFPGEGPSRYESSRREALTIASRVAQNGYTLA